MQKKVSGKDMRWYLILIIILVSGLAFVFDGPAGLTATSQPEINAPGGAEIDVAQNITKWYGSKTSPVEAVWRNFLVKAYFLEYDRRREIIKCRDQVVALQKGSSTKPISCGEIVLDLKRNFLTAREQVKLEYDEHISILGNRLEWDQKTGQFKIWEQPQIIFKEWKITGNRIEGDISKGSFTILGSVKGNGPAASFQAGKVIYDQKDEKIYLQEDPVLYQDKNELSAPEIIYDLIARKFFFNNQSKFKTIEETK